jgi:cytidyltransferase-like protein
MSEVIVAGAFDDLRSHHIRFLQEAARQGPLTVALLTDDRVAAKYGRVKFPFAERKYLLEAIRFVSRVVPAGRGEVTSPLRPTPLPDLDLAGFPVPPFDPTQIETGRKRIIVTGCYDWFHSGHVRFFEECAQLGDLYVVAGHDANVRLLKGEGHPLFSQEERRYMVSACRYVKHALISSGNGWMDAEPEIAVVKPHIYAVNEDGDKPEKRRFCAEHGLEYVVLTRTPADGLPPRSSSQLRGF